MRYDVIGDIHGEAGKLEALLGKLGYRPMSDGWRHPERTAVFVGDFVDRGPDQLRTIRIVRDMVQSASALAVLGNHELNAIAWHTPNPEEPNDFLRPHNSPRWGDSNRRQHAAFLAEVEHDPALHTDIVNWFLTLPLWLEMPAFLVVHACWHTRYIEWLRRSLKSGNQLDRGLLKDATVEPVDENEKDNELPTVFKAVEAITKGIEVPLPGGFSFLDKDGKRRHRVRLRWWDHTADTYRSSAMLSPEECATLPNDRIPDYARVTKPEKPVFFGHYWLSGTPDIRSGRSVCLDYSACRGGPLVAYRYDGETELSGRNLVWVG